MPPRESLYPADWLKIAKKDFRRVRRLLVLGDAEAAGFYLQQGVEKLLKAFLLSKGWQLERIHSLEVLLNEAVAYLPELECYREHCRRITGFYIVERYPFMDEFGLTVSEVQQSLKQIKGLVDSIIRETGSSKS